jgi:hypothetical protein
VWWGVCQPLAGICAKQLQKYEQRVTCSKIERCGSSLLPSSRQIEFWKKLMISKRNRKQKVSLKVVANAVYTAKFENRVTYEGERESG